MAKQESDFPDVIDTFEHQDTDFHPGDGVPSSDFEKMMAAILKIEQNFDNYIRSATLTVAASNSSAKAKKQADYVCDGTNDEVEIQAAINALPATGGKVLLLEGLYTCKNVELDSNTEICGTGFGTELKMPGSGISSEDSILVISNETDVVVRDIAFNGNDSGAVGTPTIGGVRLKTDTNRVLISHCKFYNNTEESSAVRVESFSSGAHTVYDVVVSSCVFNDLEVGFISFGGKNLVVANNIFRNIHAEPIVFWTTTGYEDNYHCIAIGNTIETVTSGRAIVFRATEGFSCVGNVMKTLTTGGIAFRGDVKYGSIIGNVIEAFGSAATTGGIEMLVPASSTLTDITISQNIIRNFTGASAGRGIKLDGAGAKTRLVINDNIIDDVGDHGIYLETITDSTIHDNLVKTVANYGINLAGTNSGLKVSDNVFLSCASGDINTLTGTYVTSGRDKHNLAVKVNATNPTYQIDIDADNLQIEGYNFSSINLTVDITASGANGLDTGSEASSTWYSIWAIYNPTTSTIAGLLSTSATSPTMPSGYTKKRRVGWVRNNASSNFLKFYQMGDWCWWDTQIEVLNTASPASTYTDVSCSTAAPSTCNLLYLNTSYYESGGDHASLYIRRDGASGDNIWQYSSVGNATSIMIKTSLLMACSDSQVVEYHTEATDDEAKIQVVGYYDPI